MLLIIPLVFSVQVLSERDCISFSSLESTSLDTFYLDNYTSPLYIGPNLGYYQNQGINVSGNVDFDFDGSNQEITIGGYGDSLNFNQMGYSINGGPTSYLDGSFPMTINGVTVDFDADIYFVKGYTETEVITTKWIKK